MLFSCWKCCVKALTQMHDSSAAALPLLTTTTPPISIYYSYYEHYCSYYDSAATPVTPTTTTTTTSPLLLLPSTTATLQPSPTRPSSREAHRSGRRRRGHFPARPLSRKIIDRYRNIPSVVISNDIIPRLWAQAQTTTGAHFLCLTNFAKSVKEYIH